jgi:hypothetical protein
MFCSPTKRINIRGGASSPIAKHFLDKVAHIDARPRHAVFVKFSVVFPEPVGIEKDHWCEVGGCRGIDILLAILEYLAKGAAGALRVDDARTRLGNQRFFPDAVLEVFGVGTREWRRGLGSIVPARNGEALSSRQFWHGVQNVQGLIEPEPCIVEDALPVAGVPSGAMMVSILSGSLGILARAARACSRALSVAPPKVAPRWPASIAPGPPPVTIR